MFKKQAEETVELDPRVWRVMANDEEYGPYTFAQICAFIRDERVVPDTMISAGPEAEFEQAIRHPDLQFLFERQDAEFQGPPANLVVCSRMLGSKENQLISAMNDIGRVAEAAPGIFILRTRLPLARVRDKLERIAEKDDRIVIVDASNNRIGWLHLGPEVDAHVRQTWDSRIA